MPIYSFPVIGNPSSASTRSVMLALGLVMLSLLSGFGIMHLIGLLGVNTSNLLWVPVLSTAPAVVFAMFAVVHDEAKREANFRDMSTLVTDGVLLATGIHLGERDVRRMVDGDHLDIEGGTLRIEVQPNGRNNIMVLIRDESDETSAPTSENETPAVKAQVPTDTNVQKLSVVEPRTVSIPVQTPNASTDPAKPTTSLLPNEKGAGTPAPSVTLKK